MERQSISNDLTVGRQIKYAPTSDERILAILAHALIFVAQFLAPLIIYLIKKR